MPQFETAFWQSHLFWLILSFGILYAGVYWYIFPLYEQIFQKRAELIQGPLKKAEKLAHETEILQQKEQHDKDLFDVRNKKRLDAFYQKQTERFNALANEAEKIQLTTFKKNIQKLERDEKTVLDKIPEFVIKATKGVR